MPGPLASLYVALGLDDKQYQQGIKNVTDTTRTAVSAIGLGAGAVLAGFTGLAAEGESAMAHFKAETGATQQEAEDAIASMDRLAAQNLQSFSGISEAYTSVRTNLGLVGDEAEDATNKILDFSTATGTDAVANVGKFDDVLDSWGKTASDLPGIMDQIVASNQEFGGSVDDTISALAAGAPVVKAFGGSVDDAMGLINLAKASGLEATDVFNGFKAAIAKAPPGTSLNDLIAKVSAVADDGDRARLAIELFGKQGAKLANVIKPGVDGLGDFKIAAKDAADATTDAASDIESTLPNKVHMAVQGALGQARDFATQIGPALLGVSSLASVGTSIASALKLDKAIANAFKVGLASAAADGGVKAAMSAAGSAVGGGIGASIVAGVVSVLTAPLTIAALVAAVGGWAIWNTLKDIGEKSSENFENQTKEIHDAAQQGGEDAADLAGKLAVLKAAWGDQAEAAATSYAGIDEAYHAAIESIQRSGFDRTFFSLHPGIAPTDADIQKIYEDGKAAGLAASSGFEDHFKTLRTSGGPARGAFYDAGVAAGQDFQKGLAEANLQERLASAPITVPVNVMIEGPSESQLRQQTDELGVSIGKGVGESVTSHESTSYVTKAIAENVQSAAAGAIGPAKGSGNDVGEAFAQGLKETKDDVAGAMAVLRDALLHPLRGIKTVSKIEGALASKELADGLKSKDPYIRATAEATRDGLLAKLKALHDAGYDIGKDGMKMLGLGITAGTGPAKGRAKTAAQGVKDGFDGIDWHAGGVNVGNAWATGVAAAIKSQVQSGDLHAALLSVNHRAYGDSPPPEGPLKDIDKGGFNIGLAWAKGMAGGMRTLGFDGLFESVPLAALSGGASIRHEHSGTVEVRLSGDTIAAARAQGASWDDIARMGEAVSTAHLRSIGPRQYP